MSFLHRPGLATAPGLLDPAGLDGTEDSLGDLIQGAVHDDLFLKFGLGGLVG